MASSYSFQIRKADHYNDQTPDLHIHVYYNEGRRRKLLGRYRNPSLEPVFSNERELSNTEITVLKAWLNQTEQLKKLTDCLASTLFDSHKVASKMQQFGEIVTHEGETYLNIRIPVSKRLK